MKQKRKQKKTSFRRITAVKARAHRIIHNSDLKNEFDSILVVVAPQQCVRAYFDYVLAASRVKKYTYTYECMKYTARVPPSCSPHRRSHSH